MALVQVTDVTRCNVDRDALWGFHLDSPARGSTADAYMLSFSGWVVGKRAPAVALEWEFQGGKRYRVPVSTSRPDVAKIYPQAAGADKSGFRSFVTLLGAPVDFAATARAVLQDETRVTLAEVHGTRTRLQTPSQSRLCPLLLTTMGRTGSTWVTCLLACVPQVVTYRPFQFEPRVATYWMDVLRTLSEPASYLQALVPELSGDEWWIGSKRSTALFAHHFQPDVMQVVARDNLESSAVFCQDRIDQFYRRVAELAGQTNPLYFLEKCAPNPSAVSNLISELYPEAREIILVRDLRDVFCSIQAYSKKYARAYFYPKVANSQDMIRAMREDAKLLLALWKRREQTAHLLRYEDLVCRPEESLRGVLNYLGLDGDPAGIRQVLDRAADTMPEAQRQHQTSQDPLASIGRWRHDLNPELQDVCREELRDLQMAFGYDGD